MALTDISTKLQVDKNKHKTLIGGVREFRIFEQVYGTFTAATCLKIGNIPSDAHTAGSAGATTKAILPTTASNIIGLKFQIGTGKMDVAMTQEKGLALATVTVEGFIPKVDESLLFSIEQLKGKAMMGVAIGYDKPTGIDGTQGSVPQFLIGWDNVLGVIEDTSGHAHSEFAMFLDSIELTTGAAMDEKPGAVVRFTAVQGEVPRQLILA